MLLPFLYNQCINKHVESLRRICLDQGSIPCSSTGKFEQNAMNKMFIAFLVSAHLLNLVISTHISDRWFGSRHWKIWALVLLCIAIYWYPQFYKSQNVFPSRTVIIQACDDGLLIALSAKEGVLIPVVSFKNGKIPGLQCGKYQLYTC